MVKVRDKCNFKNGLTVPCRGNSGGLAMYWKEEIRLDIQMYSQTHIDALVDRGAEVGWWHLTRFYKELDTAKRLESWAKLKHLRGTSSLPWLVIGDFNEIMGLSEKEGGKVWPNQQIGRFTEGIN